MSIEPIEDHENSGVSLLLSVWKERPKFVALLRTYLKQVQDLEDGIWSVIIRQGLEEIYPGSGRADGVSLDAIGKIVGEPRSGKTDEEYIPYIRAKVKANNSDGHVEQLIEILRLLLPEEKQRIYITNHGYMEAEIFVDSPLTDSERNAVLRFMLLAVDAVADFQVQFTFEDEDLIFSLSGTYGAEESDEDQGFGSEYDPLGGELSHTRILGEYNSEIN